MKNCDIEYPKITGIAGLIQINFIVVHVYYKLVCMFLVTI